MGYWTLGRARQHFRKESTTGKLGVRIAAAVTFDT
jgi:hypothetical protein